MEILLKYWPIILVVLNLLALWAVWSVKRGLATRDDLEAARKALDDRIDAHEVQITRMEGALEAMPKNGDIAAIYKRIDQLHGDLREVIGSLTGLRRAVDLMNEYLLKDKQ